MIKDLKFKLSNGVEIPAIGFGTWQSQGDDCYNSVLWALEAGYRHIDTAHAYGNEHLCAKAIKDSKIKREDIFITTKLPAEIKTYEGAMKHFNESLANLDTDYIDLYLIHAPWPWSAQGTDCTSGNIEVWKAFVELYNQKKVRAIGVSNFHVKDIEAIVNATGVKPVCNQIRYFIGNIQEPISKYCAENDILIEAYSPMATGEMLQSELLDPFVEKYNKSKAQICIRYCIQKNTLPLPKSVHKERVFANIDVDFEISKEDMEYFDSLYHVASTRKFRD